MVISSFSFGNVDYCVGCEMTLSLFSQMTGKDKDYRYMATSDLLNELNKDNFKADSDLEIKLSNIIIQQLDDVAGDVSGLAVKWYDSCVPLSLCPIRDVSAARVSLS